MRTDERAFGSHPGRHALLLCAAVAWLSVGIALTAAQEAANRNPAADPAILPGQPEVTVATPAAVDFDRDVRPIFARHCIECHGGVKQMSGLSFVYASSILSDQVDSGTPPVVPGKPDESELFLRVTAVADSGMRMPPVEAHPEGLSAREIDILRRWIAQGANWRDHWAYVKPESQIPPPVKDAAWPKSGIDHFILARLEQEGVAPSPAADPARWLRRVSLDLTGLPPTREEREAFLAAVSTRGEAAYEQAVDRLLASPRFGERWATMWLDVVRYADSKGLGKDETREIWGYRDWVIRAFNADMPYDQFTIKQVAGDLLPDRTVSDQVATAAHRLTQTNGEGGTDDEEFRVAAVLDRVATTWQTWQGVTFGCVQCHSHPYDPFRHEEFYRFAAFFNNTVDSDTDEEFPFVQAPLDPEQIPLATRLDRELEEIRRALFEREYPLVRDDSHWRPLSAASASLVRSAGRRGRRGPTPAEPTPLTTRANGPHTEFVAPELLAMSAGTEVRLEASLPEGMERLTAIRLTVLPLDIEKAAIDSEWGFVLSSIKAELIEPGQEEGQELKLARVLADEPTPYIDPQDSLYQPPEGGRGAGRRGRPGSGGRRGGSGRERTGYSSYSRINHPRQAAFVLQEPVDVAEGSQVRVTLRFSRGYLDSFLMAARRGYVEVSGDTSFTDWMASQEYLNLATRLEELETQRSEIGSTSVPVLRELPEHLSRPTHVFARGNFLAKAEQVEPGTPASFPPLPEGVPADRLALARWLVSPENPLTARVAVNRFWARMFERGLVWTEEDFGSSGERPSHSELLDYLAVRFQSELGWSMKSLLREIALSAVYRQSNVERPDLEMIDADNVLLARGPRQRLTAEMVRDQALALSGLLVPKLYGKPARPTIPDGVWRPFEPGTDPWEPPARGDENRYRRSIYTYTKRSIPYPMFASFDAPSREFCTPRRLVSNTPLQALFTLNDESFVEFAEGLALRMAAAAEEPREQLRAGFLLVTSREPRQEELAALVELYERTVKAENAKAADILAADEQQTTAEPPPTSVAAPPTEPSSVAADNPDDGEATEQAEAEQPDVEEPPAAEPTIDPSRVLVLTPQARRLVPAATVLLNLDEILTK